MSAEDAVPLPTRRDVRRRRRRTRGWVVAIIVALVLFAALSIAFFVADGAAKAAARDTVRERIIQVLGLEPGARVDVDLGDGFILLQALAGRVDRVDVTVPAFAFDALPGALALHAEGVPLDDAAPVERLGIRFTAGADGLAAIGSHLTGAELESVLLEDPEIVVGTTFEAFGIRLPVAMGLEPSVADGELRFAPATIRIDGQVITVESLRADPLLRPLATALLQQQSLCLADRIPAALTLTGAVVEDGRLVIDIDGSGVRLGGIGDRGTCGSDEPAG